MPRIIGVDLRERVFKIEGAGNARMEDLPGAGVGTDVVLVDGIWRVSGEKKCAG